MGAVSDLDQISILTKKVLASASARLQEDVQAGFAARRRKLQKKAETVGLSESDLLLPPAEALIRAAAAREAVGRVIDSLMLNESSPNDLAVLKMTKDLLLRRKGNDFAFPPDMIPRSVKAHAVLPGGVS